jgi:hypothetical protein
MLCRVALVRTEVSLELSVSFIRVTRIGELGTTLAVTSNRRMVRRNIRWLFTASVVPSSTILVTLMKEALSSSETSVLTRATRPNIPDDTILHSHRRENLKSYLPQGYDCAVMISSWKHICISSIYAYQAYMHIKHIALMNTKIILTTIMLNSGATSGLLNICYV